MSDESDKNDGSAKDLDARIGAKMRLFIDRMIRVACEEEGVDSDRAVDIFLCAAVQLYAEERSTSPAEMAVLTRAIVDDVVSQSDPPDTVH